MGHLVNIVSELVADVNNLTSLESLILDHNTDLHLLPATLLKMEHLTIIGLSWYVTFISLGELV